LHMVQLMPLHLKTPSPLASFKARLVFTFLVSWLTQVVLEKRPLNGCSFSLDMSLYLSSILSRVRLVYIYLIYFLLYFLFLFTGFILLRLFGGCICVYMIVRVCIELYVLLPLWRNKT